MKDLRTYINKYFGITEKDMENVSSLFYKEELEKGGYYIKEQQYCDKMSFLQSGYIRIYAKANDKEITQWISTKGYFVTDLSSFVFNQRSRWNMHALSNCTLYTIKKENYSRLIDIVPDWPEIERRFLAGCFLTIEDRVFKQLSLSAEERYEQFFEGNKELFNQVPLQYIASMLGMSPETFSRIRSKQNS